MDQAGNAINEVTPVSAATPALADSWPYTCIDIYWVDASATYGVGLKVNDVQNWDGKVAGFEIWGQDETGNARAVTALSVEPGQPFAEGEDILLDMTIVITSYSIHYTKLYEM